MSRHSWEYWFRYRTVSNNLKLVILLVPVPVPYTVVTYGTTCDYEANSINSGICCDAGTYWFMSVIISSIFYFFTTGPTLGERKIVCNYLEIDSQFLHLFFFSALPLLFADIPLRGSHHLRAGARGPLRAPPLCLLLTHPPRHTRWELNQCFGSGSGWIRIQIARLDPYSDSGSGSWKWNWAIKIHFFPNILWLSLIFKNDTYQIKVLCLIKYLLDWLKTKIKYLLFGLKTKNFSQNFVFAIKKKSFFVAWIRIRDPD